MGEPQEMVVASALPGIGIRPVEPGRWRRGIRLSGGLMPAHPMLCGRDRERTYVRTPRPSERIVGDCMGTLKRLGLAVLVFGSLVAILSIYPSPSWPATAFGVGLASIGIFSLVLTENRHNWYLQVAYTHSWLLFFLGFATRAWSSILPPALPWAAALLAAYALASLMPVISPGLSALLLREQTQPQTRAGIGCIRAAAAILPSAAGIGAIVGLLGPRHATSNSVAILVGAICTGVAVGGAQVFSEQFWRARPWKGSGDGTQPRYSA